MAHSATGIHSTGHGVDRLNSDMMTIPKVRFIASPHCDFRAHAHDIRLIVIHNISLPAGEFGGEDIIALFTGTLNTAVRPDYHALKGLRVSAHFLIRRDGELIQFVPVERRAWHCGVSAWRGWERCNDFSIGIELEGCDTTAFTDAQYAQLNALLILLRQQWPGVALAGHSDIAPGRKTDPGPYFDWKRIHG